MVAMAPLQEGPPFSSRRHACFASVEQQDQSPRIFTNTFQQSWELSSHPETQRSCSLSKQRWTRHKKMTQENATSYQSLVK